MELLWIAGVSIVCAFAVIGKVAHAEVKFWRDFERNVATLVKDPERLWGNK
jgi:hypothetical protein